MKSQYGYLHIYPQYSHHGEARIVGDELGLQTLCAAIAHALKYGEKESEALFASDGEGYSVEVEKVASLNDLEPYYSAYQKNEEAATWRERAFKAEAELSKLRSAAALKAERDAALARVAVLERTLERIANPIPYEQANVPADHVLDGRALFVALDSPEYYKRVARSALAATEKT